MVYLAVESVLGLKLVCDGVVEALLHRHLAVVQSRDKERPEHPEPCVRDRFSVIKRCSIQQQARTVAPTERAPHKRQSTGTDTGTRTQAQYYMFIPCGMREFSGMLQRYTEKQRARKEKRREQRQREAKREKQREREREEGRERGGGRTRGTE